MYNRISAEPFEGFRGWFAETHWRERANHKGLSFMLFPFFNKTWLSLLLTSFDLHCSEDERWLSADDICFTCVNSNFSHDFSPGGLRKKKRELVINANRKSMQAKSIHLLVDLGYNQLEGTRVGYYNVPHIIKAEGKSVKATQRCFFLPFCIFTN